MGSRAVVLTRRDGSGACYTRTGRAFFAGVQVGASLVSRVARAAGPLFDELSTDWLLLDCELLPWSAKAEGLIREQYASVGAAARAGLPVALGILTGARDRGLVVGPLLDRTAARLDNADRFTETYRRYCWPTDALTGVKLAPFAVLASTGAHHSARDQAWHLDRVDRLVAADPDFFQPTRRLVVDLTSPRSSDQAVEWWLTLTEAGGEGMVVKPYAGLARARGGGLAQPGIKCRGREYLRIIYGPDYTEPEHLERLRRRGLGRKRALAQREYALGLAALDRMAAGDPLWRVHEAVFGILACESEPVDPRL
jgi:PNKP (polynucleotide 5'-kinase/3'-phosphatase) family adenylyltransferase-like protein